MRLLLPFFLPAGSHERQPTSFSRDHSQQRLSRATVNSGSFLKQRSPATNDSAITKDAVVQCILAVVLFYCHICPCTVDN